MYSGTIAPGSSAVHIITVSTKESDPAMDLMADIQGLGQTPQLGSNGLSADKDTSPYSARTFITINPVTFHLNPGESKDITATITIPQNVGSGGRYGIITIHNAPIGNGTTAIVTAIAVPIMVTIQGTTKSMTGSITGVSVADVVPGQPIKILTALKNTGNYHYLAINNVSITDSTGKVVATGSADSSPRSIIPTSTGEFDVNIVAPLPIGMYSIHIKSRPDRWHCP